MTIQTNENNYCVYCHTFPNGKKYVGLTSKGVKKRWLNGRGYSKNHQRTMFYAIEKYGWGNIIHEIIEYGLSKTQSEQLEIKLIAQYKSNEIEFGYNLTSGGYAPIISDISRKRMSESQKGKVMPEEVKRKLSKANKGYVHTKEAIEKIIKASSGRVRSKETCLKMSEAQKGKKHSEETKNKMSISAKGKSKSEETKRKMSNFQRGKVVSDETRKKQSEVHKGFVISMETRKKISESVKRDWAKRKLEQSMKGV